MALVDNHLVDVERLDWHPLGIVERRVGARKNPRLEFTAERTARPEADIRKLLLGREAVIDHTEEVGFVSLWRVMCMPLFVEFSQHTMECQRFFGPRALQA